MKKNEQTPFLTLTVGRICICDKCKRRLLVEEVLAGSSHTIGMFVTCWECLDEKTKRKAKKMYPRIKIEPEEEK